MLDLYQALKATDLAAAQAIHFRLLPLFDVLFCETNPIPLKEALQTRAVPTSILNYGAMGKVMLATAPLDAA